MKLIVITTETENKGEEALINRLFKEGMGCLHLRKPGWDIDKTRRFIEQIEACYHPRIVLHDHYSLTAEFDLKGVHLNGRNRGEWQSYMPVANSLSAHGVDELAAAPASLKYTFLSPIFDSISKNGYHSGFDTDTLICYREAGIVHRGVVALGGITVNHIEQAYQLGFGGVAVLGALWGDWCHTLQEDGVIERYRLLQARCKAIRRAHIARLHYISNPALVEVQGLVQSAQEMLAGGIPLIQIRNKRMNEAQLVAVANEVRSMTHRLSRTLIINDNPFIARTVDADGVHLGKLDMPPQEARALLGDNFIIGGTANTFEDILRLHRTGVDYIGLGPFRFTTTKENLSATLGETGYRDVLKACAQAAIDTPIVAIGGITPEDVPMLMQTGIYGIAMSGALAVEDKELRKLTIDNILNQIDKYER